jgi:hypothetical protein
MDNIDLEFVAATKKQHLDVCAYSLANAYLNQHINDPLMMYHSEVISQELKLELLSLINAEWQRLQDELKQMKESPFA